MVHISIHSNLKHFLSDKNNFKSLSKWSKSVSSAQILDSIDYGSNSNTPYGPYDMDYIIWSKIVQSIHADVQWNLVEAIVYAYTSNFDIQTLFKLYIKLYLSPKLLAHFLSSLKGLKLLSVILSFGSSEMIWNELD